MKKISKKIALFLLSFGILIIALSQILSRYVELSDLTKGLFIGVGIGFLILSVSKGDFKTVK